MIHRILLIAAFALAQPTAPLLLAPASASLSSPPFCASGYYRNSRGNCVPRPRRAAQAPAGASAKCRDGTYSFSQSRRGTCSYHGGVAVWL